MDLGLKGKVALITGGSRGIGAATALELAHEGADTVLVGRDADTAARTAVAITAGTGRRSIAIPADLRDTGAADAVVAQAVAAFGRLDVLVNSAGATTHGDLFALADADWQDGFALKFHGTVRMCRAAWPHLAASGGAVVTIIGVASRTPMPNAMIVGSVNSALLSFTKALSDLGSRDGVRVNAINPGFIATDRLTRRLDSTAQAQGITREDAAAALLKTLGVSRFGTPEEIGRLACFLASPRAGYLQGAAVDADGGLTKGI
jgi:NAD(P)-dependent dehydrogenase (short-subunit alcohol dehydrogenase family)